MAYVGGALLTAATVPQAWRLWRTRDAGAFTWGFVLLNTVGILLLAWRSWEIGERAFLVLNVTTAAFWALVAWCKLAGSSRTFKRALHNAEPRGPSVAKHAEG